MKSKMFKCSEKSEVLSFQVLDDVKLKMQSTMYKLKFASESKILRYERI